MSTENKTSKRGRPVVEGSKRQARLNAQAAKVAAGGTIAKLTTKPLFPSRVTWAPPLSTAWGLALGELE